MNRCIDFTAWSLARLACLGCRPTVGTNDVVVLGKARESVGDGLKWEERVATSAYLEECTMADAPVWDAVRGRGGCAGKREEENAAGLDSPACGDGRSFSLFASIKEGVAYYTTSKEPTATHISRPSLVL